MLILTIRTDKPEAEIGLFDDEQRLECLAWPADRQLAETIHVKLKKILESRQKDLHDLEGIVVFKGPGSFTGLRIGLSVANALANSLQVPIVSETGDDWLSVGTKRLQKGDNEKIALPEYGAPPRTTTPKH